MDGDDSSASCGSTEAAVKPTFRPDRTLKLRDLTPHLTCGLCAGYLINAATVIECLHSFCRSCIVRHLHLNRDCPTCRKVIHEAYPMQHIRMDRTMSDIVYKLVPGLQQDEKERERAYNEEHGIVPEERSDHECETNHSYAVPTNGVQSIGATAGSSVTNLSRACDAAAPTADLDNDELIAIHLKRREAKDAKKTPSPSKKLQRPYLCMSSKASINILRKYIRTKLTLSESTNVEVLFDDQVLGKEHSLEFLSRTRWRLKKSEIVNLAYSIETA